MIATRGAALFMVSLSKPKAISFVKKLSNRVMIREKSAINIINFKKTETEKTLFLFEAVYEGKKLWVNAPSANILLKRFGSLKATKNISLYIFAPRIDAVSRSLMKPKILEKSIPKLFVKIDFKIML